MFFSSPSLWAPREISCGSIWIEKRRQLREETKRNETEKIYQERYFHFNIYFCWLFNKNLSFSYGQRQFPNLRWCRTFCGHKLLGFLGWSKAGSPWAELVNRLTTFFCGSNVGGLFLILLLLLLLLLLLRRNNEVKFQINKFLLFLIWKIISFGLEGPREISFDAQTIVFWLKR